jgi:guanylate kinase
MVTFFDAAMMIFIIPLQLGSPEQFLIDRHHDVPDAIERSLRMCVHALS